MRSWGMRVYVTKRTQHWSTGTAVPSIQEGKGQTEMGTEVGTSARKDIQFSSVTQLCPTFCDPMDCSMPGFPVHHQLISSTSNEYSGLISFRIDWLDLLAIQRALKSLLQYHSSKASILQHLAFFLVQLSHPYMTTGKTCSDQLPLLHCASVLFMEMVQQIVLYFLTS